MIEGEELSNRPPKNVRYAVWRKYFKNNTNGRCFVCRQPLRIENFEAGHVTALAKGGNNHISNLRVVHSECNNAMGTQNMEDYKREYYSKDPKKTRKRKEESSAALIIVILIIVYLYLKSHGMI